MCISEKSGETGSVDSSVEGGEAAEALLPMDDLVASVFVENRSRFKGFLRKHLPDDAIAEDLLQQVLLQAMGKGGSLKNHESAVAWFFRILRNTLTDFYRSRAAEGRKHDALHREMSAHGEDFSPPPDEELQAEVCACMGRLLPALKPEYADLIRRIELGGESTAAVAESAGISYNNLMVRLHRARQALKTSLQRSCGVCSEHGCLDCSCKPSAA